MATETNVVAFDAHRYRRTTAPSSTSGSDEILTIPQPNHWVNDAGSVLVGGSAAVAVEELYPEASATSPVLHAAARLLRDAVSRLESARDELRADEDLAADDHVHHFEALLRELFCCRSLGDGFGSVINAVRIACRNRRGSPLTQDQLGALLALMRRLREHPFLRLDDALDEIDTLESVGLLPDPESLSLLADQDVDSAR